MVTWITWAHALRGSVGTWVAWVKFLRWLHGLRGSKYFLRGSKFYVGHNSYVGCVGQIYFFVGQFFLRGSKSFCLDLCVGQIFLRGSIIFALVNFYLLDEIILLYYNY